MKKIMIMLVVMAVSVVSVSAQKDTVSVNFSGDVSYFTKNVSLATGLKFGDNPALVVHMNTLLEFKDFNLSAAYSGHIGIQRIQDGDHFHMFDFSADYMISKKLNLSIGYELTYTDMTHGEFGHGVFAIGTFTGERLSSNVIFFADPSFKSTYYIGSTDVKVGKNMSLYVLGGYTNTKTSPWYGLFGIKYTSSNFTTGLYIISGNGIAFNIGIQF